MRQCHEVVAVRHGRWLTRRSQVFANFADYGTPDAELTLGYYFWVVRGPDSVVLVDTGSADAVAKRRGREVLMPPRQAFTLLGLDPAAPIDIVLTHAHYDHIGNLDHFTDCTVHLSRAELDFWTGPRADHHLFRELVEADEIAHLRELHRAGRVRFAEDHPQVRPGIELISAPGHTPGQLMVSVQTRDGVVLLASDAVHLDEELREDMPFRHMCDLDDSYQTYAAIRALGDVTVVAGHEDSVIDRHLPISGPLADHAVLIGAGR